MSSTATTTPAIITDYFTRAQGIITQLEAYRATEEELLAIPLAEFTTANTTTATGIWEDLKSDRVERLGSNELILPLLTREQRGEVGVLTDRICVLRREVVDLYVALVPRLKC